MTAENQWRRCSACKNPIAFGSTHWVCDVSTCNRKRTGLVFCSVSCWEVHLPVARHRKAYALERTAPATAEAAGAAPARDRRRIIPANQSSGRAPSPVPPALIITSRLKDYVRSRAGFNTSDRVVDPLSEIVRRICDRAIENARREGRRTVLDRDIPLD